MHVALVSTYPPTKCGIANYSENLGMALGGVSGVELTVLGEKLDGAAGGENVNRPWHRKQDWVGQILAELATLGPEVVHIQHEEAILGQDSRLPKLLRGIRELKIASAVTLHSVYQGSLGVPGLRYSGRRFQKELGELADRIIVHQVDGCQDVLLEQGVAAAKVAVIPHGTTVFDLQDKADARRALGIENDAKLLLAIGFIHKKKGLHTLVQALPAVQARIPELRFLVAGSFRTRPWDILYNKQLRSSLKSGIDRGLIDLREGFHSNAAMKTFLAAADLLALPYRQRYGSASGVLHLAVGAGVPVICADGYKFAEAKRAWGSQQPEYFPPPGDPTAWADAIANALSQPTVLQQLADESRKLGRATSWPDIAEAHVRGFRAALEERSKSSA